MPGLYLLHPHIPAIGTALPPRLPGKAKNDQNQGVGLKFFLAWLMAFYYHATRNFWGYYIYRGEKPEKMTRNTPGP
jgi:hypothetical protein